MESDLEKMEETPSVIETIRLRCGSSDPIIASPTKSKDRQDVVYPLNELGHYVVGVENTTSSVD